MMKDRELERIILDMKKGLVNFKDLSILDRNEEKLAYAAVKLDSENYSYIGRSLRDEEKLALEYMKKEGSKLENLDEEYRKNRLFIMDVLDSRASLTEDFFTAIDETLLNDESFMLDLIEKNGNAIIFAPNSIKKDENVILQIIDTAEEGKYQLDGKFISILTPNLKNEKSVIIRAIKCMENSQAKIAALYLEKEMKSDIDVALELAKKDGYTLNEIDNNLLRNKSFINECIKNDWKTLRYLTQLNPLVKYDDEIAETAKNQNIKSLIYLDDRFKKVYKEEWDEYNKKIDNVSSFAELWWEKEIKGSSIDPSNTSIIIMDESKESYEIYNPYMQVSLKQVIRSKLLSSDDDRVMLFSDYGIKVNNIPFNKEVHEELGQKSPWYPLMSITPERVKVNHQLLYYGNNNPRELNHQSSRLVELRTKKEKLLLEKEKLLYLEKFIDESILIEEDEISRAR